MRTRGTVVQTRCTLGVEPGDPAVRALTRDTLCLRGVSNRPPLPTDSLDQQQPAPDVQRSITVGHEDLRTVEDDTSPTAPGGLRHVNTRPECHQPPGRVHLAADGGVADKPVEDVLWDEKKRQRLVCAEGLGMSRIIWEDFWGPARVRARNRLLAEYAVTEARFGSRLPERLARFAATVRRPPAA